jgi:hypothetical protein
MPRNPGLNDAIPSGYFSPRLGVEKSAGLLPCNPPLNIIF